MAASNRRTSLGSLTDSQNSLYNTFMVEYSTTVLRLYPATYNLNGFIRKTTVNTDINILAYKGGSALADGTYNVYAYTDNDNVEWDYEVVSTVTVAKTNSLLLGTIIIASSIITGSIITGVNSYNVSAALGLSGQVQAVAAQVCPIGTILSYGGVTAPTGWLECAGQSVNRIGAYANLFTAIGTAFGSASVSTFNLPDLRGKFLRGWDHAAGIDPDKATRTGKTGGATGDNVGSLQADDFKAHTHTIGQDTTGQAGTGNSFNKNNGIQASGSAGGLETRPINVYVMYIIKY